MQLIKNRNIKILAGNIKYFNKVHNLFDKFTFEFLDSLSQEILTNPQAKKHSDLISLGFWIRKKNLEIIKKKYDDETLRIGIGLTFHITPSNVAMNFAYSFVLSILGGNSNIIRVSNVEFDQKNIFFKILNKVFNKKKFKLIKDTNQFISYNYEMDNSITQYLSSICDCRVVWGSDKTIKSIKNCPTKATCKDIIFPDKYSISIINLNYLASKNKNHISDLAQKFYLDSLMFEQNACTSPHLIFWYGKKKNSTYNLFWKCLNSSISKGKLFSLNEKNMIDRYSKFCEFAAKRDEIETSFKDNFIFRTKLKSIPSDIYNLRVGYGYYFEYFLKNIFEIKKYISPKIQTLTYAGFDPKELKNMILDLKPNGIDRIVPFGRALEFNEIWDGYDLPRCFSKIIDIK